MKWAGRPSWHRFHNSGGLKTRNGKERDSKWPKSKGIKWDRKIKFQADSKNIGKHGHRRLHHVRVAKRKTWLELELALLACPWRYTQVKHLCEGVVYIHLRLSTGPTLLLSKALPHQRWSPKRWFQMVSVLVLSSRWLSIGPNLGHKQGQEEQNCERKSLPHQKVTLYQMLPRIRPGWQCWRGDSFREHSQTHQGLSLLDLRWFFSCFFQVAKSSSLHFDFDPRANRTASWFVHANRTLFRPAHCPTLV